MHWEKQSGRFPRDPRLGHRTGCYYKPTNNAQKNLNDLYTSGDGFISNTSECTTSAITPGKKIILIIGGSLAMGLGATENEATIAANLYRKIKKHHGDNYCVVNAGCAAYCSWQEFIKFSLELSKLKPSHVVSISSWNDFVHSSIGDRFTGEWLINHDRSIDDLSDRLIGLDERVSIRSLLKQYLSRSTLGEKIIKGYMKLRRGSEISSDEIRWGYHSSNFVYKKESVENYVHNMSMINAISNSIGANFLCIIQPIISVCSAPTRAAQDLRRLGKLHKNFFFARDQFYSSLHAKIQLPFMHASPGIEPEYFADHCHLNNDGQAIMSDYIYNLIKAELK